MPQVFAFTTNYNKIVNELRTQVKVSKPPLSSNLPKDSSGYKTFEAIWDTGATHSVITERVVIECNLFPFGISQIQSATEIKTCEVYYVSLILRNHVGIPKIKVSKLPVGGADVLIGMDIISLGDFAVTNKEGKTTFSFRIPPVERIDFVESSKKRTPLLLKAKVGRNHTCPCGSGKKYKKCCGK